MSRDATFESQKACVPSYDLRDRLTSWQSIQPVQQRSIRGLDLKNSDHRKGNVQLQ